MKKFTLFFLANLVEISKKGYFPLIVPEFFLKYFEMLFAFMVIFLKRPSFLH